MAAKGKGRATPAARWRKCIGCGVKTDQRNAFGGAPQCWKCFYKSLSEKRGDELGGKEHKIRELKNQMENDRVERRGLERNLAARTRERDLAQRRIEAQKRTILHLVGMLCEERDRSAGLGETIENDQWRREQEAAAAPRNEAQAPVRDACASDSGTGDQVIKVPGGVFTPHRLGQILRLAKDGRTALMRVEDIRPAKNGFDTRYYGRHCYGGGAAVYHCDAQLPTLADLDTWRKHNPKDRYAAQAHAVKGGGA